MPEGVNLVVETASVELLVPPAVRATVVGLNDALGPFAMIGVMDADRDAPVVRPELASTIVVDPVAPATMIPLEGMDVIVKFPATMILKIVECEILPLVAVIVTEYVPASVKVVVEIVRVEVLEPPNARD